GKIRRFTEHSRSRNLDLRSLHQLQAQLVRLQKRLRPRKDRRESPGRYEPRRLSAARPAGASVKLAAAIAVTAVLLIIVAALPSAQPQIPSGREVVSSSA